MQPNHAYGLGDLPTTWRERAAFLEQFGDPTSARLWRLAALELEHALKALGDETLTLVEAAAVSGYSADHLGHLVRHGQLRNCGRKNAPRVRRADLPMKSSTKPGRPVHPQADTGRITNISKLTLDVPLAESPAQHIRNGLMLPLRSR